MYLVIGTVYIFLLCTHIDESSTVMIPGHNGYYSNKDLHFLEQLKNFVVFVFLRLCVIYKFPFTCSGCKLLQLWFPSSSETSEKFTINTLFLGSSGDESVPKKEIRP